MQASALRAEIIDVDNMWENTQRDTCVLSQ
jgi:hypothetical protein